MNLPDKEKFVHPASGVAMALLVALLPFAAANATETDPGEAWVQQCQDWDEWDKSGPAFRIHGNTYYVGTCGIAAILVTGEEGHILIDSGTQAGAQVVAENITSLGFELADVKILLQSHEHFDHVGGMAALQAMTGARLIASPGAAPVMASGRSTADDPQAGMHDPFPAARVDAVLDRRGKVELGSLSLRAIRTPGHTPGALSWRWQSCDGADCKTIVYADSLSPVSADEYRFSDHPRYVGSYYKGLGRVAASDCDILVTPHPSASGMRARLQQGELEDTTACLAYASAIGKRLGTRIDEELKGSGE